MKRFIFAFSGALAFFALSLGTPDVWAQARQHGGGGGGTRTNSGGGSSGGTAVSRGSGGGSGGGQGSGSGGSHVSGSGGGRTSGPASSGQGGTSVARPRGDRPNAGNPVIGQAAERNGRYYGRQDGRTYRYYPYDPYYLYGYGAFGLGALYYDPFWWGGSPYGYGYGYGYPGGYGGGYGGGYYDYDRQDDGVKGGLKLKVEPKYAEVYVDGYYVGVVDDYNGVFQRLNLLAGPHRVELRAKGYETLAFDVKVEPRSTISYHGELQPQQAR
jgi:hypothetical protein